MIPLILGGQQPSKMFDDAMRERKAKIDNSLKAYNALLEGIKGKGFFEEYAEFQYHAKLHEDILKRHNFSGISSEEMTFVDCLHSYQRMLEENHFLYQEIRNIILYHRHRLNYAMDSCKKRVRGCKLEPLQIRWLDTAFLELVVILKKVGPLLAVMQQGASE